MNENKENPARITSDDVVVSGRDVEGSKDDFTCLDGYDVDGVEFLKSMV